ncbi:hypothetical protein BDV25DRAFT_17361 [Aspergillus avenaceus]|uniref:Uncharacterized protein n=1 Tax=Aspergillus avenaceus TaxID=36643 RepID=A0A5N6TQ13_ASPAV|nr:hypothetical protein BDV25DRAFT_17361 [Aspergillus avenaceus]
MRWPATSTISFLTLVCSNAHIAISSAVSQDAVDSVSLFQDDRIPTVRFQVLRPGWGNEGETPLLFELSVDAQDGSCDGTSISVNGKRLGHSWDGSFGYGSGDILLPHINNFTPLYASWESICSPQPDSSNEKTNQLLTVRIRQDNDDGSANSFSFTSLLALTQPPEILSLCITPWGPSINGFPVSRVFRRIKCRPVHIDASSTGENEPEQELKVQKLLQYTHANSQLKEGDCGSLECKANPLLTDVPGLLDRLKHRVGGFSISLIGRICFWHSGPSKPMNHSEQIRVDPTKDTSRFVYEGSHDPTSALPFSTTSKKSFPVLEMALSYEPSKRDYAKICLVTILVSCVIALVLKIAHSTMYCRRRRVDRAARREERRARMAYKSAARRLRWRRWWEGGPYEPVPIGHDLPVIRQQSHDLESGTESNVPPEGEPMWNEIQDFRQTLEYVRELVQQPKCSSPHLPRGNGNHDAADLPIKRSKSPTTIASSVVNLSTVISTDTTSLMSLDDLSSATVDTLETSSTNPPSYHE